MVGLNVVMLNTVINLLICRLLLQTIVIQTFPLVDFLSYNMFIVQCNGKFSGNEVKIMLLLHDLRIV